MGWTTLHRVPGTTDREFFEAEFPDTLTRNGEILDCATGGGAFYAAVRTRETGQVWALVVLVRRSGAGAGRWGNFGYKEMDERMGPVEARCPARLLDLLSPLPECRHEQDYCRLCETEITQDGRHWLSAATPRQAPEAASPRCTRGYPYGATAPDGGAPFHEPGGTALCGTCWARRWRQACRASAGRQAKARAVRPGTRVRFACPLRFANGDQRDTFIFDKRSTFRAPDSEHRYRIRNWRTGYDYEVLSAPPPEAGTGTAQSPAGRSRQDRTPQAAR